ncbi:MAG: 23S rRNA (adenine(2503)-C(2))-methyltransferase RlmN [Erysipelothrix sp.]|nr:23S rRNA (adenine(2503)-C(2))-methyltransferase RlmN [Erysipelothrix sp.]
MKDIYGYNLKDLEKYLEEKNMKKFRAKQLYAWLYKKRVNSFDEMSDLARDFRDVLKSEFDMSELTLKDKQESSDGTIKYLFELSDGHLIETVLMNNDYGKSVCVTSQVGCAMGCKFCASGLLKKKRGLTTGEMVKQILYVQKHLDERNDRVRNIVIMGIGEPFDNYDNAINFMNIVNDDHGLEIGARRITVSTCGLAPKIREFADGNYQYNLAISLHAPNDELRNKIMPINKVYPLSELLASLDYYSNKSNRRITLEYILLKGVNDTHECAKELAEIVKGRNAYVNLIPYNSVDEADFKSTSDLESLKFYDMLMKLNVKATLRAKHGDDIEAACGQLRAQAER